MQHSLSGVILKALLVADILSQDVQGLVTRLIRHFENAGAVTGGARQESAPQTVRERGWSWRHIVAEIGGMSEVLIVGALLGQMKLTKPQCERAAQLFGLTEGGKRLLNEIPTRGTQMPPTDPLIYRLYELVTVR